MKKIVALLSFMLLLSIGNVVAQSFTIKGHIKGIEAGDTLRFEKVVLPSWDFEKAFDLIADTYGEFAYSGEHPHTQYYAMRYLPVNGTAPETTVYGLRILIRDGEIRIDGVRDFIYYSTVSGGFYDDELKVIRALDDSLEMERLALWSRHDKFNSFRTDNSVHFERLRAMESDYALKICNEYVAANICEMLWKPLEELEDSYSKLTTEAQKSYYGTILNSNIEKIKSLSVGRAAPDFTFKTINSEAVSLSDLRGKYVIVYHFGLCPGSIQMDPLVAELYNNHSDKVEVIGLTESMENLKKTSYDIPEDAVMNGVNFKKAITNMTNHPWKYEAETTTDKNAAFIDNFNVNGLPYFVAISPDGLIVSRGFSEAFDEAAKIIK